MEVLHLLQELNRIEHLLDTVEYSSRVPITAWYERRDAAIKKLEALGFEVVETEGRWGVFVSGMREGYPEQWE